MKELSGGLLLAVLAAGQVGVWIMTGLMNMFRFIYGIVPGKAVELV